MDSSNPAIDGDFPWKTVVKTAVHEIRTPLSALCTSIEILKMNRLDTEQAHKMLLMMNRQVDAIIGQLDTLLNRPAAYLENPPVPHE